MNVLTTQLTALVTAIAPLDALAREHRDETLAWLHGTDDVFRRFRPRTPSPHLVSYFLLVDREQQSVLLCDHRLAGRWLPTGGHVEPGEHPRATVDREAGEELGIDAAYDRRTGDRPFFLTVSETVGDPEHRHTDVSLWFALAGRVGQPLAPDEGEFREVRWWPTSELADVDPSRFEPHLPRALAALCLTGQEPSTVSGVSPSR